jgi:hypothetical protein
MPATATAGQFAAGDTSVGFGPFSVKTRNFGRWSSDAASMQPYLSFTPSANSLMRRCLVRRQNERLFSALWARTWPMPGFSFILRFLRVITNAYFVRAMRSSARNFSNSPKKPIGGYTAFEIRFYQTMAEDHARKSVGECHPYREFEGMQPSI